ncbi:hypothetical protein BH23CHL2_BH23CHL2_07850 [soil metagenome]
MTSDRFARAIRLLDVFSDADRLQVIGRLIDDEKTVTQLASELSMKPHAVARHVRTLEDAGLILSNDDRPGLLTFDVASLREQTAALRPNEPDEFSEATDADGRILGRFVTDGLLVQLPGQRRRWQVVLGWLAKQFEPGRSYPESEVNEILGAIYEDYALLRRQLVDEGFMARERGIYWRIEDASNASQDGHG